MYFKPQRGRPPQIVWKGILLNEVCIIVFHYVKAFGYIVGPAHMQKFLDDEHVQQSFLQCAIDANLPSKSHQDDGKIYNALFQKCIYSLF